VVKKAKSDGDGKKYLLHRRNRAQKQINNSSIQSINQISDSTQTMNTLSLLARSTIAKPAPWRIVAKAVSVRLPVKYFSTVKEEVPDNDYVNGHLLTDHLEYMEDMVRYKQTFLSDVDEKTEVSGECVLTKPIHSYTTA
jgi:hypothetical protein